MWNGRLRRLSMKNWEFHIQHSSSQQNENHSKLIIQNSKIQEQWRKTYINPALQVVTLQYQHQILAGSTLGSPVQDVVTPDDEDIDYNNDGLDDDEGDV